MRHNGIQLAKRKPAPKWNFEERPDKVSTKAKEARRENRLSKSRRQTRFRLWTVEELEALPDPEWLIEDILPKGGLGILYGQPAAGKSFLALDWANCVAAGQEWCKRDVKAGDVVYICAEGASGLKLRVNAWRKVHNRELERLRFLPQSLNMLDENDVCAFIREIQAHKCEPSLIIIDTLARCFGDGDENAAQHMNAFVAGTDAFRQAFPSTTVLVVHHSGKNAKKGLRGNSALKGAADSVVCLSNNNGLLTMECKKQKDDERLTQIKLELRKVELGNGKSSCVIELASGAATSLVSTNPMTGDPRSKDTDRKAIDALKSLGPKGVSFSEWQKASGLKKSTFKDARKRLLETKQVKQDGNQYFIAQKGPRAETRLEQGLKDAA